MNEDSTMWLVQEVVDLLPVSPVGLYEFIWILRPKYPAMADAELIKLAERSVKYLLDTKAGVLVKMSWPQSQSTPVTNDEIIPVTAWEAPKPEGNYFAMAQIPAA